jgi:hypothetical protein
MAPICHFVKTKEGQFKLEKKSQRFSEARKIKLHLSIILSTNTARRKGHNPPGQGSSGKVGLCPGQNPDEEKQRCFSWRTRRIRSSLAFVPLEAVFASKTVDTSFRSKELPPLLRSSRAGQDTHTREGADLAFCREWLLYGKSSSSTCGSPPGSGHDYPLLARQEHAKQLPGACVQWQQLLISSPMRALSRSNWAFQ